MSASPAVRSLRAAVFAAVCVLLGAAGHGLAMGVMPPLWADAAGFLAVFCLGWLLGGRERSLAGIGVAMFVTQAGLHVGFGAAAQARTVHPAHAMHMAHGHTMAAMSAMSGAQHPHAVTAHATAAHILAALIASWWLRRGEAALWSLLRRAVSLVPGLVAWWRGVPIPIPVPVPGRRPSRTPDLAGPPRRLHLRYALLRRGPPPIPYAL
ncbi:hypothetical protein [Streptomyces sp. NPDC002758]